MNIVKKFKLINKIIKIAELVEEKHKTNKESLKDVAFFIKTYIPEAKEMVDEIKKILKG